jgi:hypothetical protein
MIRRRYSYTDLEAARWALIFGYDTAYDLARDAHRAALERDASLADSADVPARSVAARYAREELDRTSSRVVGLVYRGREVLALIDPRDRSNLFTLHLVFDEGWEVVDELDEEDFARNGGRREQ